MQSQNYQYATQNWSNIDPAYHNQFASHKVTQTRGGSKVVESQTPMKTGFMGKLENMAQRGSEMLGMSGNSSSRWALFGIQEPLLAEYPAKTAYGEGSKLGGWVFLSENHFGWISHTDSMNRVVKTLIPFSNVSNIIPSSRVRGVTRGTYRFNPIVSPGIKPDGFQLLTKDGLVYQFFGMKNIELVFNLLNSQWQNRYASGFQSGLAQGGFTSGSHAHQPQSFAQQPQSFAQQPQSFTQQPTSFTQGYQQPVASQQTYSSVPAGTNTVPLSQQFVGKHATQPFNSSYASTTTDPAYLNKGFPSSSQTFVNQPATTAAFTANHPSYQPQVASTPLGQTAPGQRTLF